MVQKLTFVSMALITETRKGLAHVERRESETGDEGDLH